VHAKDLQIDREGLYQNGRDVAWHGLAIPRRRVGDVRWNHFISRLTAAAYGLRGQCGARRPVLREIRRLVKKGFMNRPRALRPFIK